MNFVSQYTNSLSYFGIGSLTSILIALARWNIENISPSELARDPFLLATITQDLPDSFSLVLSIVLFFGVYALGSIVCRLGEAQALIQRKSIYRWRRLLRDTLAHKNETVRVFCVSQFQTIIVWNGLAGISTIAFIIGLLNTIIRYDYLTWQGFVAWLVLPACLVTVAHIARVQKQTEIEFLLKGQ
nr:hypothetical protein [uncultured Roseovarius sp.]